MFNRRISKGRMQNIHFTHKECLVLHSSRLICKTVKSKVSAIVRSVASQEQPRHLACNEELATS